MLKTWIDEIRTQTSIYRSECWKYHLSGNVVEFSILPVYLKNKKLYRCSVISVGQVLLALSDKIKNQRLNFHIQSFPTLENPEIVASIRMDQAVDSTKHSRTPDREVNRKQDLTKILNNLVKQHQLRLRKIEDFSILKMDEDLSFENYNSWVNISSVYNNPFTWLNLGYFKESLRGQLSHLPADYIAIFDLCSIRKKQSQDQQTDKKEYVQFLIGI